MTSLLLLSLGTGAVSGFLDRHLADHPGRVRIGYVADAPSSADHTGLDLVDFVVVPHADGALAPYPPALIEHTLQAYGEEFSLCPVRHDQALLVDGQGARLVASA